MTEGTGNMDSGNRTTPLNRLQLPKIIHPVFLQRVLIRPLLANPSIPTELR